MEVRWRATVSESSSVQRHGSRFGIFSVNFWERVADWCLGEVTTRECSERAYVDLREYVETLDRNRIGYWQLRVPSSIRETHMAFFPVGTTGEEHDAQLATVCAPPSLNRRSDL